ncbi:hypothetical protein SCHPADRAFT_847590 [Schizopora paradoxa]|uniref:EKC/KEOPS complex subunit BUD32 n=1 Tax=Schizopora paradoxa TaxID=27342 RepID=A0A0H2RXN1_9AGAM|nr:hypothetical protein SCHPADRAFT_847590 [Schizopora paradoxa]
MTPTVALLESSTLIRQGAEAKVYKSYLYDGQISGSDARGEPILLKYRFNKQYRHPTLNSTLTRQRIAQETRSLMKCLRSGVHVPGLRMVDAQEGVIGIEWIEGESVRVLLGAEDEETEGTGDTSDLPDLEQLEHDPLAKFNTTSSHVMRLIGTEIAKMHAADVIHGDLTTSNMMLRQRSDEGTEVLIDFGLSYVSALAEDKAVDLYVLERAFASTHPDSEPLFQTVLDAYSKINSKEWKAVGRKLDEVRLRGRKRSMVG